MEQVKGLHGDCHYFISIFEWHSSNYNLNPVSVELIYGCTHSARQRHRGVRCPPGSWLRGECARLSVAAAAAHWAEAQLSGPCLLTDDTSCFTLVEMLPGNTHKKMTCSRYLTCAKYNLLYRCELREPSPNPLLNSEQQLSLFQAFVMQTYSKTLSCLLMTELSVPALGTSPYLFLHLLPKGRSANWPVGCLGVCCKERKSTLLETWQACCLSTSVLWLVCTGPGSTLISTLQLHHHHKCSLCSNLSTPLSAL